MAWGEHRRSKRSSSALVARLREVVALGVLVSVVSLGWMPRTSPAYATLRPAVPTRVACKSQGLANRRLAVLFAGMLAPLDEAVAQTYTGIASVEAVELLNRLEKSMVKGANASLSNFTLAERRLILRTKKDKIRKAWEETATQGAKALSLIQLKYEDPIRIITGGMRTVKREMMLERQLFAGIEEDWAANATALATVKDTVPQLMDEFLALMDQELNALGKKKREYGRSLIFEAAKVFDKWTTAIDEVTASSAQGQVIPAWPISGALVL
mmetsp:Transcript_2820/g.6762  ORF Transcript_2820/g.6762 Transcript_2820/m.6762 type:complete len:270 (+) Transcript_2820:64-873(+)